MNSTQNNRKKSKILLLIPLFLLVFVLINIILMIALGQISDTIALPFVVITFFTTLLAPLPSIILAVLGIIYTVKAKRNGECNIGWRLVTGIIDIIIPIVLLWCIYAFFIVGMSV